MHTFANQGADGTAWWSIVPSVLWFLLILTLVLLFQGELRAVLKEFSRRIRTGSAVKLFSFEFGQSYIPQGINAEKDEMTLPHREDEGAQRFNERKAYYEPNRRIFLVHRLAPSHTPGMLYDIQLYLLPHKDATLISVTKVEYYFGVHWGNMIFTSEDRAHGFLVTTSAFGPFVCTAKLFFTDGQDVIVSRYVDFEMGRIGPQA